MAAGSCQSASWSYLCVKRGTWEAHNKCAWQQHGVRLHGWVSRISLCSGLCESEMQLLGPAGWGAPVVAARAESLLANGDTQLQDHAGEQAGWVLKVLYFLGHAPGNHTRTGAPGSSVDGGSGMWLIAWVSSIRWGARLLVRT